MTTGDERIARLEALGYTEREAVFLVMAALHSGYFLRRQYQDFLGTRRGYADATLAEKVVAKGHARTLPSFGKTLVYHLCTRPFYNAIDQPDNRHRRDRPPFAVKVKLMALDYVMAEPGRSFLATEEEKVAFFDGQLGIPREKLPAKLYRSRTSGSTTRRYFVEKFPISVDGVAGRDRAVVSFCYVDEGVIATPSLETYLREYADLFRSLGSFRLVYVTTRSRAFASAEGMFQRFLRGSGRWSTTSERRSPERLLAWVRLEHLFRTRQFDSLDAAKLDELRRLRQEFRGRETESLYERWREAGDQVVRDFIAAQTVSGPLAGEFVPYRLEHDYGFLGLDG
jgi:hypothetical protein